MRSACLRRLHTPFPKAWKPPTPHAQPQLFVPFLLSRPQLLLSFSAFPAQFTLKGEVLYVSSPGRVNVEFIPKKEGDARKALDLERKQFITLYPSELYHFWSPASSSSITRETKDFKKRLTFQQTASTLELSLTVQPRSGGAATPRLEVLQPGELWLVQAYLKHALPSLTGWVALGGDYSVLQQNLALDAESAPHGHKDHKCDENCGHAH